MFSKVRKIWRAAPIATTILAVAVIVAVVFVVRTASMAVYWNDPARRDQDIAMWMTPGYVAHSWRVPRKVVFDALNAPDGLPNGPMSLSEIATFLDIPEPQLIAQIQAAIAEFAEDGSGPQTEPKPAGSDADE